MNKGQWATDQGAEAWEEHVAEAARQFLNSAVVIDDRAFKGKGTDKDLAVLEQDTSSTMPAERGGGPHGPLPHEGPLPKATLPGRAIGNQSVDAESTIAQVSLSHSSDGSSAQDLDLSALTDSFAEVGIICGIVDPGTIGERFGTRSGSVCKEELLVNRACKMAEAADILIIDWFLKPRSSELTLEVLRQVLQSDRRHGGRTRLICVYTGEHGLVEIRDQVRDRLSDVCAFSAAAERDEIRLVASSLSIVFVNKKGVDTEHSITESELPNRLVAEFAKVINGILPSFAATAIGSLRHRAHSILETFNSSMDAAYVSSRAISDPSEEVSQLVRELLVSEFDSQIGFSQAADRCLSTDAITMWLLAPGRMKSSGSIQLTSREDSQQKTIKGGCVAEFVRSAACGEIASLEKPFELAGSLYTMSEGQRLKLSEVMCADSDEASRVEQEFSRLVSNKREAFGRNFVADEWRPSLTLGTLLVSSDGSKASYFMCINRACEMLRLSRERKSVVLLSLDEKSRGFNLVVPISGGASAQLRVPSEFSSMARVEFRVDQNTRRIMADRKDNEGTKRFVFENTSRDIEYQYLGELRYLRAFRDVNEMARSSTALGIADSEWLRLNARRK